MYAGEVDKSFDMVLQGTTAPHTSYRHYTSSFHEVFHVRRQTICRLKYNTTRQKIYSHIYIKI